MAKIGKRILSAFIDIEPRTNGPVAGKNSDPGKSSDPVTGRSGVTGNTPGQTALRQEEYSPPADPRFTEYFDKLFSEANIPGPDYYEFSKMIGAMQAVPDEQSRFYAAFAGLQVQGLDKEKLLSTAGEYLRILTADADRFHKTVEAALQEKVQGRIAEAEEKGQRILALSREITELQDRITALQTEIKENKEKIEASSGGYVAECERRKTRIGSDMEKIKHYIH
jgi:hypothetical protein